VLRRFRELVQQRRLRLEMGCIAKKKKKKARLLISQIVGQVSDKYE
jgi:hypothetical protein